MYYLPQSELFNLTRNTKNIFGGNRILGSFARDPHISTDFSSPGGGSEKGRPERCLSQEGSKGLPAASLDYRWEKPKPKVMPLGYFH